MALVGDGSTGWYQGNDGILGAGIVNIFYGADDNDPVSNVLETNIMINQDSPNIEGGAEDNDHFGSALAAFRPKLRSKTIAPLYYLLLD